MTQLQKLALYSTLREAFAGRSFNICGVDKACSMLGRPVYANNMDWHTMKALHCVEWKHFDIQTKQELMETVARVLGMPVDVTRMEITSGSLFVTAGDNRTE
jgi:hypothetical protein